MRLVIQAMAAVALVAAQSSPGLAQTAAPAAPPPATVQAPPPSPAVPPSTAVPEATAPAAGATAAPHKGRRHGKRVSMSQRFKSANPTNDGHLTLDQAKSANWTYVTRHFDAMDTGHKGYVTEADIHAYAHARYLARHASAKPGVGSAAPAAAAPAPAQ